MYPLVKQFHNFHRTLTFYSYLVDHCLSSVSLNLTKIVHAQLIKVGFNNHTFLGNRCLELYTQFQCIGDILKAFDDIPRKNNISWNICLKGLLNCGHNEMAHSLFQKMPERDVVSWNSIISWHASHRHSDSVWGIFREMLSVGVKPSGYTYSILVSMVFNALHGKELHGSLIRSGLIRSSVVLGNSLIDMYGKLATIDYAFGVFFMMEQLDVITWNSLIMGCCKAGYGELAFSQFSLMRSLGYSPDEFTCSSVITCCTNLRNLDKGRQIFALCFKAGFLGNSIISSAIIDLFSKCNKLKYSVQLFKEVERWDSTVCNSMISSYSWHGIAENALHILVLTLRENIRPTEFTLSCVLTSLCGISVEQGTQIHALVVKLGFGLDDIVASSLLYMYTKFGLINYATKIFASMVQRDLISWNTMIVGLTHNGRLVEAIDTFKELHRSGPPPDRISLAGVLLACSYGCFVDEGRAILSEMEEHYGVTPCSEHYISVIGLLCRAGRLNEVMEILERMPYEPNSLVWKLLLHACVVHGDVKLAEIVATRLMELEPQLSLPYLVLAQIYEMRSQWEDSVRMRETMKRNTPRKVTGCSWIGIKNSVYTFMSDELQHHTGKEIYSILRLLTCEKDETTCIEN